MYGNGPQDLLMLRQLLGQLSPNYAQVAMLVGLLLVVIYRPERICHLGMFRASCVLLAISLVLPPLVGVFVGTFSSAMSGYSRSSGSDFMIFAAFLNLVEPALIAVSICLGIFSLLPPRQEGDRRGPPQHPIDT